MMRKTTAASCFVLAWISAVTVSCGSPDPNDGGPESEGEGFGGALANTGGAPAGGISGVTAVGGTGVGGDANVAAGGMPAAGGSTTRTTGPERCSLLRLGRHRGAGRSAASAS